MTALAWAARSLSAATSAALTNLPDRVAFEVRLRIPRVPAGISERRKARSKDTLPLEIAFTYTLYAHDAALHVRAEWTNRHRDHRLTVEFPTPFATRRTDAGSTFDLVPHKAPFLQASCRNFVTAAEGGSRLTILSRAMHSYDTAHEGRLTLAKCLLKATSCVNPDLLPWWPAPEGNCLRPIVQEYAILPGRARDKWHALQAAADGLVCPPLIEYFTSAGPQPQGVLPASASFLDVPAPLHLSAFKRCRHRPSLLVRVYNASTHAARARLAVSPLLRVRKAYRTDLREKCQGPLKFDGRHVEVPCRPKEIVSIELA